MLKIIQGNLVDMFMDNQFDVIIHQCNCFNTMGAGIAKVLASRFPTVRIVDNTTKVGDINKLGTYTKTSTQFGDIINLYSQYGYGRDFGTPTSYLAMEHGLKQLAETYSGKKIGTYWLGCSLGGADKNKVETIIKNTIGLHCDVTIVEYNK